MKTQPFYFSNKSSAVILLPVIVSLAIVISACSFNVPSVDPSKRQTDVSRSVESTLNAEKVATYQVQQTQNAAQPVATQADDSQYQFHNPGSTGHAGCPVHFVVSPVHPARSRRYATGSPNSRTGGID